MTARSRGTRSILPPSPSRASAADSGRGSKSKPSMTRDIRAEETPARIESTGFWLFKSEPGTYSIEDLAREGRTLWDGIRNYQARNFIRDTMRPGDRVLFYHSNADPPAIVGVARIIGSPVPDMTAFDRSNHGYDPKSRSENPTWFAIEIEFQSRLGDPVTLESMRSDPRFRGMLLLAKGQRLSIQPVIESHFRSALEVARHRD